MKEADLGRLVVSWHETDGWDVYQEVEHAGFRADVVAVKDGRVQVVEIKTSLTFEVMSQARRWLPHANSVLVAVPAPKKDGDGRAFAREVLLWAGVGMMELRVFGSGRWSASFPVPPITRFLQLPDAKRVGSDALIAALRPEHRTHAQAGSPSGGHWTPFKDTCAQLLELANASPGISVAEAVGKIRHHYRNNGSATRSISKWGSRKKIPGVAVEFKGGKAYILPRP